MSVRVRLTRVGSKKNPIWRVVVADQRSPRDGRFIETIGHYNPQTEPSTIVIDGERLQHWLARGAQPTGTVKQLVKAQAKGLTADPRTSAAVAAATPAAAAPEVTGSSALDRSRRPRRRRRSSRPPRPRRPPLWRPRPRPRCLRPRCPRLRRAAPETADAEPPAAEADAPAGETAAEETATD